MIATANVASAFRQTLGGLGVIYSLAFVLWLVSRKRRSHGAGAICRRRAGMSGRGLYLQSLRSARLKACVAVDTSGSCIGDLPQFFSELTSLLGTFGNYEITVIQCDAKVGSVEEFSSDKPLPKDYEWKVTGGGGTSFVPVFDYIKEHGMRPDVFIYVTDGYGDAPKKAPPYPVMWVLTSDGSEDFAPWGWKIHLNPLAK